MKSNNITRNILSDSGTVICAENEDCFVQCNPYGCQDSTIQCPTGPHSCSVICTGSYACNPLTINGGGGDLTVFGQNKVLTDYESPLQSTVINCPRSKSCHLKCLGTDSCRAVDVKGLLASSLHIETVYSEGYYNYALRYADIWCPNDGVRGSTSCTFTIGSGKSILSGADIYAVEGFNDIMVYNNCPSCTLGGLTDSYLHCTESLTSTCTLDLSNAWPWYCEEGTSPCVNYLLPTTKPTHTPTTEPTPQTDNPSAYPTLEPTLDPTVEPTFSPSVAPTLAPSISPTRYPTADHYEMYMEVEYGLNVTEYAVIVNITDNAIHTFNKIERFLEQAFVHEKNVLISYKDFWCRILGVNNHDYSGILTLETEIICDEMECLHLSSRYDKNTFEMFMTDTLRTYFHDDMLLFYVVSMSNPILRRMETTEYQIPVTEGTEIEQESGEYAGGSADLKAAKYNDVFYFLLGITFFIIFIGFTACAYNDGVCCTFPMMRGCYVVDDGKWFAVIIFALHFYDFTSDINLTIEIWSNDEVFNDYLILASGIGTLLFILIPYFTNIYIASNIKSIIGDNEWTLSWFENNSRTFIGFVVSTGSCYSSLALISSNIFGMNKFSSGLTSYGLKKLSKIRILANVCLENIPQLIFQIIYVSSIGGFTNAVVFSFVASILSVISTTLSWWIDRKSTNTSVIEYFLVTKCEGNRVISDQDQQHETDAKGIVLPKMVSAPPLHRIITPSIGSRVTSVSSGIRSQLTRREKINIITNKGKRRTLSRHLAEVFSVPHRNLQIGNSTITTHGFITHIVHFYYDSDLLVVENKSSEMKPKEFIRQLYGLLQNEVDELFRSHFQLSPDFLVTIKFAVSQKHTLGREPIDSDSEQHPSSPEKGHHDKQNTSNAGIQVIDAMYKMHAK